MPSTKRRWTGERANETEILTIGLPGWCPMDGENPLLLEDSTCSLVGICRSGSHLEAHAAESPCADVSCQERAKSSSRLLWASAVGELLHIAGSRTLVATVLRHQCRQHCGKRPLHEAAGIGRPSHRLSLIGYGTLLQNHRIAIVQHGLLGRNMFQAMSPAKTQGSSLHGQRCPCCSPEAVQAVHIACGELDAAGDSALHLAAWMGMGA